MRYFADLHIHSRFSRATSRHLDLRELAETAKTKGIGIMGTGDFTHPAWLKELRSNLKWQDGIYEFNRVLFIPTSEVSLMYTKGGKGRRIHYLIFAPDLDIVDQINGFLGRHGRLDYDGRPIFGMSSEKLLEGLVSISKDIALVPAHCWTPWFSIFGSKSGFDSVEECFGDLSKHIFALETGLSSDPAMNWRLSSLDKYALVSFSDAHSSAKLGRECCLFDLKNPSYNELISAMKEKDPEKFLMTVEFNPEEGKYHWDGHRNCNVVQSPQETIKNGDKCKVCGKQLTIGVAYRVEQLADREEGYKPKGAIPFKPLIPLVELIAISAGSGVATKKVKAEYEFLTRKFGTEFSVLLEAQEEELKRACAEDLAKLIVKNRAAGLKIEPGYDGVYGRIATEQQGGLEDFVR